MADSRSVKQFNVYLPIELIRELKHHAVDTEQSLSAIVTAAISEHLERHGHAASKRSKDRRASSGN